MQRIIHLFKKISLNKRMYLWYTYYVVLCELIVEPIKPNYISVIINTYGGKVYGKKENNPAR